MKTSKYAVLTIVLTTLLTTTGQYFLKLGAERVNDLWSLFNIFLVTGIIVYGVSALLLIISLKYGELSVLYPFISLSFVWVFIVSQVILNESVLLLNWLGLLAIVMGVSIIGWGVRSG